MFNFLTKRSVSPTHVLSLLLLVFSFFMGRTAASSSPVLHYDEPASRWTEALPIGNGRLGAMVFGGPQEERIQFNEDTLWAGQPYRAARDLSGKTLGRIQQLIFDGEYKRAQKQVQKHMLGRPVREMAYQTVGHLKLTFPGHKSVEQYQRRLNLNRATASVQYRHEGIRFTRTTFVSPVDQVIVLRLEAGKPGELAFDVSLNTPQQARIETRENRTIWMNGTNGSYKGIKGTMPFATGVRLRVEGAEPRVKNGRLQVRGATTATIYVAAATAHRGPRDISGRPVPEVRKTLHEALNKSYAQLRSDHVREHRRLFDRVSLDLGSSPENVAGLTTDERLDRFNQNRDPELAALFVQYARYLMLSSSRPGSQPANLQGVWNREMEPPWEGNYTLNINAQMNYWIAEVANLPECHRPLIRMVKQLSETGSVVAEQTYNADGWVAHHNTDLWRRAAPADGAKWGQYQTGGAWLSQHLWQHYAFNRDRQYLADVYPVLKGACRFFLDSLVEHPEFGWPVTCPSNSPENPHHSGVTVCAGPTVDMQIIRDLFRKTEKAADLLDRDSSFRVKLRETRRRLAPMQVGQHGQLQEWLHDWDDPDDNHRHVAHLYGLFPGSQITPKQTPELAQAARKSLNMRDNTSVGWRKAWNVGWRTRLNEPQRAYQSFSALLTDYTFPNMLTTVWKDRPPFQIEAGLGGAAGVLQMLLQSHSGEIHLLPALPEAWSSGSFEGLRARGDFEVDAEWQNGRLNGATIRSRSGNRLRLRHRERTATYETEPGQTLRLDGQLRLR